MTVTFHCKHFAALNVEDLYEILALRQEVFVVEQNCVYLDSDGKDKQGWHIWGTDQTGKMVACARILPKGISYDNYSSVGRVATALSIRGKGIGKILMREALEWSGQIFGGVPIKISAQQYLERFYSEFGFVQVGTSYLEDGIPHIPMVRQPPVPL